MLRARRSARLANTTPPHQTKSAKRDEFVFTYLEGNPAGVGARGSCGEPRGAPGATRLSRIECPVAAPGVSTASDTSPGPRRLRNEIEAEKTFLKPQTLSKLNGDNG